MGRKSIYPDEFSKSDRVRLAQGKFRKAGGIIMSVRLKPETADALRELQAEGYGTSKTDIINKAVMDALQAVMSDYDYDNEEDDEIPVGMHEQLNGR